MASNPDRAPRSIPAHLCRALWITFAALGLGLAVLVAARSRGLGVVDPSPAHRLNVFYVLFDTNEPFGILVAALILGLAASSLRFRKGRISEDDGRQSAENETSGLFGGAARQRYWIGALAVTVTVVTWIGTETVHYAYPLSMDEYGAEMQARIFASGSLQAQMPEEWEPSAYALTPIFVTLTEDGHWVSQYLPVYALMRASTLWAHPQMLLNPILTGLCVLLVAAVARRLFPEEGGAPLMAALFLATSSQVLVNGMSFYSMPAHLAFNLMWLLLYLRDDRRGWIGVVILGFLAMGLHQFVMHVLFAFPLLLRPVLRRRWGLATVLASAYGLGLLSWVLWVGEVRNRLSSASIAASFGLPGIQQIFDQGMSLTQIVTWQAPVVIVLALVAFLQVRRLGADLRYIAFSMVFSLAFYGFALSNQGHGWGYRYFYPVLGNLVLLSVAGWSFLATGRFRGRLTAFVAVGLLGSCLLQLPVRMIQVEAFIGPFAAAYGFLQSQDADIVVIHGEGAWYGRDLVRNDPLFRERPLVMRSEGLTGREIGGLVQRYRVATLPPAALEPYGLTVLSPYPDKLLWRAGP